ncbi:LlaJI family restriction endonuclease [Emcibacteraceae bacterium]|nr:LlaJI family restriction endonuclease [Emcibacteraceae bacterium]
MDLKIYYDRSVKQDLPPDLLKELEQRDLVAINEQQTISFVGAVIHSGCINIFLPRSSGDIPDKEKYKYAALTMNVVEKFGHKSKTRSMAVEHGVNSAEKINLTLVKDLLSDFQQNGLYARHHREVRINSGKPDWKRTVNCILPVFSKSGSPVYLDYYSSRNRHSIDNIVSNIHSEIISFLDLNFSWWITGSEKKQIAPELLGTSYWADNVEMKLSILKQELSNVYSDRDIILLENLIKFLKRTEGRNQSSIIAGLKDFHNVWETMLRDICLGVVDLNNQLPRPVYIDKFDIKHVTTGMLTDIILENEVKNKLAVIDAKYYKSLVIGDAPATPDIVKQFFYEQVLKIIKPTHEITNSFIFPGKNGPFDEIKMFTNKGLSLSEDRFKPINCIYICPLEVMEHYLDGKKMLSINNF